MKQAGFEDSIVQSMGEKEFFIRKAIGWALGEYSKTNPIQCNVIYWKKS